MGGAIQPRSFLLSVPMSRILKPTFLNFLKYLIGQVPFDSLNEFERGLDASFRALKLEPDTVRHVLRDCAEYFKGWLNGWWWILQGDEATYKFEMFAPVFVIRCGDKKATLGRLFRGKPFDGMFIVTVCPKTGKISVQSPPYPQRAK